MRFGFISEPYWPAGQDRPQLWQKPLCWFSSIRCEAGEHSGRAALPATLLVVLALGASPVRAKPVELDRSFGAGAPGRDYAWSPAEFSTASCSGGTWSRRAADQSPDPKAAYSRFGNSSLTRLRENGSLDASFRESRAHGLGVGELWPGDRLCRTRSSWPDARSLSRSRGGHRRGHRGYLAFSPRRPHSTFGSGGAAYTRWAFPAITEPNCSPLRRVARFERTGVTVDSHYRIVVTGFLHQTGDVRFASHVARRLLLADSPASGAVHAAFGSPRRPPALYRLAAGFHSSCCARHTPVVPHANASRHAVLYVLPPHAPLLPRHPHHTTPLRTTPLHALHATRRPTDRRSPGFARRQLHRAWQRESPASPEQTAIPCPHAPRRRSSLV